MRQRLMLSTAAIGLMLASGFAYAQGPGERREEPRRTEEPAKGATSPRGGMQERAQERAQGAQDRLQGERLQGAGREDKGGPAKREAADDKRQPAQASERDQPKARDQAEDSREPSRDRNREAESTKGRDSGKSSAETKQDKQDKSAPQKSTAESEKSKSGQQNERTGATANQNERNQPQPRNAEQDNNRPATATDTNRTAPTNNAQTAPGTSSTQTNQANQTTQTNTQVNQQTQVTTEKQVRISETVSRARLAPPERNLNISIRVGETIPRRVRLHRLPPEIVSIEPAYRDYEYFATEEEVVIVEPRTQRIVSQVPRDPSRARAQMGGNGSSTVAAAGASKVNCQIMRRDASGQVAEAEPSTVGSTARVDSLSVIVQMPDSGSSAPIALGAPAGNIVVATQGQGDCTVTLEPQTR